MRYVIPQSIRISFKPVLSAALSALLALSGVPAGAGAASHGVSEPVERAAIVSVYELAREEGVRAPVRIVRADDSSSPSTFSSSFGAPVPRFTARFLALEDDNSHLQPDAHGAIGPSHAVVMANSQMRIHTRGAEIISTVSLDNFWSPVGGSPDAFSPRIFYDAIARRWFAVASANRNSAGSALLFGASRTSDPNGTWNLYRLSGAQANLSNEWIDSPNVGFNGTWVVVSADIYDVGNTATPKRSQTWAIEKADLYAGASGVTVTRFPNDTTNFSLMPAVVHDAAQTDMFLVSRLNAASGSVRLFRIQGAVGAETLTALGDVTSSIGGWSAAPAGANFAPQLDGGGIDVGNDRVQNAVFRNNALWFAQTVFLPAGGAPTRSAVQWWQINLANPTSPSLKQNARLDDPSGAKFFAVPSLAVNRDDEMLIGYTRFGADQYPSANYSFHYPLDGVNSMRDDTVMKEGEGPYVKTGGGTNRWSGNSAALVEPGNDYLMWTLQAFAAAPSGSGDGSGRWGLWWIQVVPSDLGVSLTTTKPSVAVDRILTYNVSVDNLGARGFTNVMAELTLPPDSTFVPGASSTDCTESGGKVRCGVGVVAAAGSGPESQRIASIAVRPAKLGSVNATATFIAKETDGNSSNNVATLATPVNPSTNVYPNPWKPGDEDFGSAAGPCGNGLIFDSLPADSTIRIYNVLGDLVRRMDVTAADNGCKAWDGKNDSGSEIASGIYLAVIKTPSGEDVRKIAVEK
jgi:uncharacterized repeat protein (TIGR01451 family)